MQRRKLFIYFIRVMPLSIYKNVASTQNTSSMSNMYHKFRISEQALRFNNEIYSLH